MAVMAPNKKAVSKKNIQQMIQDLRLQMHDALIEREDEVDVTLTGLVARVGVLLVGPPGTAKTLTLEMVSKALKCSFFYWLIGKFTEPDEIFGPIDIKALKEGVRKRVVKGKLPVADLAVLDEIWKCNTAIGNSMLRIANERKYDDGSGEVDVPLIAPFAASNEYPQDAELGAMFDRFVLRKNVERIERPSNRLRLMKMHGKPVKVESQLAKTDLENAHNEALLLPFDDDIWMRAHEIVEKCVSEGIRCSDRRLGLIGRVVSAYAYVCGASKVQISHLDILKYMLWSDPQNQPVACRKIVAQLAGTVGTDINNLYLQIENTVRNDSADIAKEKLENIRENNLSKLPKEETRVKKLSDFLDQQIREATLRAGGYRG